jgi:hypothetical protein
METFFFTDEKPNNIAKELNAQGDFDPMHEQALGFIASLVMNTYYPYTFSIEDLERDCDYDKQYIMSALNELLDKGNVIQEGAFYRGLIRTVGSD